ncbi:hypothetical protein AX774_g801 [Zancudomyces culisetae]|uniref:Uncharacterized protein n=1 Tax=Zancudomyces culisetae TaxID=1213189 RepID=A0A1R1PXI8_ZANCU|nr:hypothetical protein AX774_g801 [Zancudomyces culisetae]|eukprot:OMH85652.1 hypothetical protein AX774_g801 [Zancudomyces culisetae]
MNISQAKHHIDELFSLFNTHTSSLVLPALNINNILIDELHPVMLRLGMLLQRLNNIPDSLRIYKSIYYHTLQSLSSSSPFPQASLLPFTRENHVSPLQDTRSLTNTFALAALHILSISISISTSNTDTDPNNTPIGMNIHTADLYQNLQHLLMNGSVGTANKDSTILSPLFICAFNLLSSILEVSNTTLLGKK